MTEPTHRTVAGLSVPLPLVPRIIESMYARYPVATAGITDPDAAVRAALRAWVVETLVTHEEEKAMAPLPTAIANTVTSYEEKATLARQKALGDAEHIVDETDPPPSAA